MGRDSTRARKGWTALGLPLLVLVLLVLGACGDDSGASDAGPPEPTGDPCQPGQTMVNCMCASDGMFRGVRYCGDDGVWGECMCREVNDSGQLSCREGQRVICSGCGTTEKWEVLCDADGNYDCSCDARPGRDAGS